MFVLFLILAIVLGIMWQQERKKNADIAKQLDDATERISNLSRFEQILNAEEEAEKIRSSAAADAERVRSEAKADAERIRSEANEEAKSLRSDAKEVNQKSRQRLEDAQAEANRKIDSANDEAKRIVSEAEKKAEEIAGDAYAALKSVDELKKTERAIKNTIQGYGDEWLKPSYSLLDELADEFSHTDAGLKLKDARANSARMVKEGLAADCDYVENNRKTTAIHFVVDAFNGKVDSILSKTKKENYGKLEQQILDAFQLVNENGTAFRNARITPEYRDSRLQELRWAITVNELKAQAQDEQRQIKEQMREEARAQREYERTQREAAKEEAMLKKAMEKVEAKLAEASAEQKAKYEAEIADLQVKLKEAEEKNQRALSMAQQTKHGNVYVISNIGSFGENIYKVGMTRRFNPMDRVKELGDASVPFSFDVHAFIESDDAPALEHSLHKALAMMQVNKVNPRKEFFRASLSDIRALVESTGAKVHWTMEAEAADYRETLAIEERLRNDPEAQKQWEEFYSRISSDSDQNDE